MNAEGTRKVAGLKLRIAIVWLAIFLVAIFAYGMMSASRPVSISAIPEVPQEAEPIIVTFKLKNPSPQTSTIEYQFYANGELLRTGVATIAPLCSKEYQYVYKNPLQIGEQVNFVVKAASGQDRWEKIVSMPAYPPQIWSSFVSFASFSTSVMTSMTTMTYYQSSFGTQDGWNIGLILSLVLIALLVFLELTWTRMRRKTLTIVGSLRTRFGSLSLLLFIIFMGMVFTKIVLIIVA